MADEERTQRSSSSSSPATLTILARRWRLQSQSRKDGRYYTLIQGVDADRVSLSLGIITAEAADRYLAGMAWLEEHWVIWLAARRSMKEKRSFKVDRKETLGRRGLAPGIIDADAEDKEPPGHLSALLVSPTPEGRDSVLPEGTGERNVQGELRVGFYRMEGFGGGATINPRWLVEHARRGKTERDEVLRFLWATGEYVQEHPCSEGTSTTLPPDTLLGGIPVPQIHKSMHLCLYVERVLAPIAKAKNADTWRREKRLWDHYILPRLGNLPLGALDARGFDAFLMSFTLDDGSEPSGATRGLVRAAYKGMLVHAHRFGHIDGVHEFFRLDGRTKKRRYQGVVLTLGELDRLVAAARDPMHAALFAFAFESGCRPSEVVRLSWEGISWDQTKKYPFGRCVVGVTKTGKVQHMMPLGPRSRRHLEALHEVARRPFDGRVFIWKGKPIANYGHALGTAAENAGIEKNVTPYVLRHSCATHLSSQGMDSGDVAKWLHHTNPRMLREYYDHSEVAARIDVRRAFSGDADEAGEVEE